MSGFYVPCCLCVLILSVSMVTSHKNILETAEGEEPENPIRNQGFVQDKAHIKEHAQGKMKFDEDTATEGEVAFQFFSSHDTNKDGVLDGLELYHSLEHGITEHIQRIEQTELERAKKDQRILNMYTSLERSVDRILKEDDKDEDGYLSYLEFSKARLAGHALRPKH